MEETTKNVANDSCGGRPQHLRKRKLKVLVITMGGERQEHIRAMFEDLKDDFEAPIFSRGVPQRDLRNRFRFLYWANEAGLLPAKEWEALCQAQEKGNYEGSNSNNLFQDALLNIPVTTDGRRGSPYDLKLHYSVEFWRKGRGLNRGRSVLACTLAHLIALRTLSEHNLDMIVEDNVRSCLPPDSGADRIWETLQAVREWEAMDTTNINHQCHLLYFGWLGSRTNLKWILKTHAAKRQFVRADRKCLATIVPFPIQDHLDEDLSEMEANEKWVDGEYHKSNSTIEGPNINQEQHSNDGKYQHLRPGGNAVWGSYAYWMSPKGYEKLLENLRNDVGAMLWKGKRARTYSVKPIDKILPRQTITSFGASSVQLATQPAFYRAPMLTSKIHTKWDPEFCESTEFQLLEQSGSLDWSNLWLSPMEQDVVEHRYKTGDWLTFSELQMQ